MRFKQRTHLLFTMYHYFSAYICTMRRLLFLLLLVASLPAYSQTDSAKVKYIYDFVTVNAGYGTNIVSPSGKTARPWWAKSGPVITLSGIWAPKQSYMYIPVTIGYSAPAFSLSEFATNNTDTNKLSSYAGGSAGNYHIYYLLAGIGIKIPGHTTRYAIELRFTTGPLVSTFPHVSYTSNIPAAPLYTTTRTVTTYINPATAIGIAISAGISAGYKLNKHWGLMANADLLSAGLRFTPSQTTSDNINQPQSIIIRSSYNYAMYTAGIVYTLGTIIPNIEY